MEGESDPKPKTSFGSKRYTKKEEIKKGKENQSDNLPVQPNQKLSEDLAGMMDKIVTQLDMITRTVVMLEKRLSQNESLVKEAYEAFSEFKSTREQDHIP